MADEHLRHAHADGGMSVVPTGVHDAGRLRPVGDVVFFVDGQRVHVEAQQHRGRVRRQVIAFDDGDNACLADAKR